MTNLFTCLSNWKLKYLCALLVCICVGVGQICAAAIKTSDLNFGTPDVDYNFNAVTGVPKSQTGNTDGAAYSTSLSGYGGITSYWFGKNTSCKVSIKASATPMTSQYVELGATSNGAIAGFQRTFATKGAYSFNIAKTSVGFVGIYATSAGISDAAVYAKANSSVYLNFTGSKIQINNGSGGWVDAVSDMTDLPSLFEVVVIYNNTNTGTTYGSSITLSSKRAHIYVNGNAVMDGAGTAPKEFTIPGASLTGFRMAYNSTATIKLDDIKIYDALPTAACDYSVDLDDNSPSNGSVSWSTTSLTTCDATAANRQVTLTIDPDDGYTLTGFSYSTGDGKVSPNSTNSDAASLTENSSAAQELTIEFDQNADGDCVANATFSEMVVTSWTWTYNSSALPALLDVYVGQKIQIDVVMSPSGVLTAHKNKDSYSHSVESTYIGNPTRAAAYFTFEGKAATDKTTITLTHNDDTSTPKEFQQSIDVRVLALPSVTFTDLVHGETFGTVTATVSADKLTVTTTKKTPTHADVDDPGSSYNTCERGHLHLVGWIDKDWVDDGHLDATHSEITSAGSGVFYGTNADIDLVVKNGKTFYAVWGHEVTE